MFAYHILALFSQFLWYAYSILSCEYTYIFCTTSSQFFFQFLREQHPFHHFFGYQTRQPLFSVFFIPFKALSNVSSIMASHVVLSRQPPLSICCFCKRWSVWRRSIARIHQLSNHSRSHYIKGSLTVLKILFTSFLLRSHEMNHRQCSFIKSRLGILRFTCAAFVTGGQIDTIAKLLHIYLHFD